MTSQRPTHPSAGIGGCPSAGIGGCPSAGIGGGACPARSSRARLLLRALGAVLSTALAACGGGGGDAGGGSDTTAPTVSLTAPASLADGLPGLLTISATAADDVSVAGVEFQVDGATVGGGEDTSAPYAVTVDTSNWASGQHVVRARARDVSGNRSAWATATVRFGGSRGVQAGFTKTENWVGGLAGATAIAQAPDGRLFVAEQGGALRVVKNGALLATPFVARTVDSTGERGLLGVALHPGFANNGFVYIYYTRINGAARNNRIARFTASAGTPDVATGTEVVIADLPDLSGATNHNGGALHFGGDGKLYVGVGDNANGALAQNLASPLGKLLRFNDDGSIPADNPFAGTQTGLARAVWAYGLRNPFTFAVQPGTGRLHVNDVGQSAWEEINLGAAGANYGWPASEGGDNVTAGVTAPLFAYGHAAAAPAGSGPGGFFTGSAIVGGAFYPAAGPFPAEMRGSYFFADLGSKWIARLDLVNGNAASTFANVADTPVDLLVGTAGELFVLTRSGITRITAP